MIEELVAQSVQLQQGPEERRKMPLDASDKDLPDRRVGCTLNAQGESR